MFPESWRIRLHLLDRSGADVSFDGAPGNEEFGRASAFGSELRRRRLRYVLDVPANTAIRDLGEAPAPVAGLVFRRVQLTPDGLGLLKEFFVVQGQYLDFVGRRRARRGGRA